MSPTTLGALPRITLLFLCCFWISSASFAQVSNSESTAISVYDRFGDPYELEDIVIPHNSEIAGIFRLHFADEENTTGSGFDGGSGPARRALLVKVFEDVTEMIGGFTQNPYTGITATCGSSSTPFPDCRLIEIDVRESANSGSAGFDGRGSAFYKVCGLPEVNSGAIWQYVNTGWNPWQLLPYGTSLTPFTAPPLSPAYGNHAYYHGWMQFNWATNWNESLTAAPSGSQYDFYTVALREALHMLGLSSNISGSGNSIFGGQSPGIYSHWDLHLQTSGGTSLINFDLDAGNCWNAAFNPATAADLTANCGGVEFDGPSINHEVYTNPIWDPAASLEFFNCSNAAGWVLNKDAQLGVAQRFPSAKELKALCAIGYELTGTYGTAGSGVVLHPTSYPGVSHSTNNDVVTYSLSSCPQTHRIAATDDFGNYAPDANYLGSQTWDNSGNFSVNQGSFIDISVPALLFNDYNADKMACQPQVIIGGGTAVLNTTGSTLTYTPDPAFSGTAVLRYRARNTLGERSNSAYIFIQVGAIQCTYTGVCGENLICDGDFEQVDPCDYEVGTHGDYGAFGANFIQPSNTPDLQPNSCNNVCNIQPPNGIQHPCADDAVFFCGTNINYPSPPLTAGNTQYAALFGGVSTSETIAFPLKRKLKGNCHELAFNYSASCPIEAVFVFSDGPPCSNMMAWPTVGSLPCLAAGASSYNVLHIETVGLAPIPLGQNNTLQWGSYTHSINSPAVANAEWVTIYVQDPNQTAAFLGLLLDDLLLTDCSTEEMTIDPVTVSTNSPCPGDVVTIEYVVCNTGNVSYISDVTLEALLQGTSAALPVIANNDFTSQGIGTITASTGNPFHPGECETLLLEIQVPSNAIPSSNYCVQLTFPGGPCIQGAAQVDCFTIGFPTIELEKTIISDGPYHPGSFIEYEITVSNPSGVSVSGVIIEDILPSGLTYFSSTGSWASNGTTNITNPVNVAANGGEETYRIKAVISPSFGCGSIENCATVIAGSPYCGPLEACAPVTVTLSGPPVYSGSAYKHVSCHGGCDGAITVGPTGNNIWFSVVNPPACYGPPQSVPGPTIGPLSAGTYTIQVNDLNTNCVEQFQVTITEPPLLVANGIFNDPTCVGDCDGSIMVMVNGGTPPYTYLFGGNSVGASIPNLCGNLSYIVDVVDAKGCTAQVSGTLWDPQAITATNMTINPVSCGNVCDGLMSTNLGGGTGALTWAHYPPGWITPTQTGNVPFFSDNTLCIGNHLLRVTDANGCQEDFYFTIPGPDPIVTGFTTTPETCVGDNDGSITTTITGGVAPLSFAWSGPGGFTSTTQNLTNLAPGTYCLTVTDADGCQNVLPDCVTVGSPVPVSGFGTVIKPPCNGSCDGIIDLQGTGGTGPYVFHVIGPNVPPPGLGVNGTQWTAACDGVYTFEAMDAHGCTGTFTVTVTDPPLLTMSVTPTSPSCFGVCDGSITVSGSGGGGTYEYRLNGGAWQTGNTFPMLCGNQTYTVSVKDNNDCEITQNVFLIEPAQLTLTSTIIHETCPGACDGEIIPNPSGGTQPYTVQITDPNGTPIKWDGLCAGPYTVHVTDANGCTFGLSYVINPGVNFNPWPKLPTTNVVSDAGRGTSIAVREWSDEYYMTGHFTGSLTFYTNKGPVITLIASGGLNDQDAFVAKFDECGVVWAYGFGSSDGTNNSPDRGNDILIDPDQGVYVGGSINGGWEGYLDIDYQNSLIQNLSTTNSTPHQVVDDLNVRKGFVLKIDDVTGVPLWAWIAGTTPNEPTEVKDLALQSGGVVAAFDYWGNLNLDNANGLPGLGGSDIGLVNLTDLGAYQVADFFGSQGDDFVEGIAGYYNSGTNQLGSVLTGSIDATSGNLIFNNNNVFTGGTPDEDVFVARYITHGTTMTPMNITTFGGAGDDHGLGIVANSSSAVTGPTIFVTGHYDGAYYPVSGPPYLSAGGRDAFVTALDWNLTHQWTLEGGGTGSDEGHALTFASNGNLYAAGHYAGFMNANSGFAVGYPMTGSNNDEEMFILEIDPTTPLVTGNWPTPGNLGNGQHNRIYDIAAGDSYLYTTGGFGGNGVFSGAQYTFNGITGTSTSALWSPYYARIDWFGAYQQKTDVAGITEEMEVATATELSIFPNPTNGEFTVKWTHDQIESLEVLDLNGRLIHRINQLEGRQSMIFDLYGHAQGVYLIRLVSDHGVETKKLVKE